MRFLPLILSGAMAPGLATPATAAGLFPYGVERTTLDNGLKVLLVPMPSDGLVAYWSIVRTGSRDEVEPGVTGFAHFFEHMMFRGSEKYPGKVYDEIVKSMGADANAYTTDDLTAYHMSLTRDDLPKVIDIESDRFKNLKYDQAQFKTEAGAVYGEFRKGRTSPFFVLYEALSNAAFDRHTYKHTTIGFEADIKKMPEQYDYSWTFFRRFYRPENVVILVAGDFDAKGTLEAIRKAYGDWAKGYKAPAVPEEPPQTAQRRIQVPFEGQTLPILAVTFKGERLLPSDRRMAAAVLIQDLAFGETSPLYKKLVLNEQRVQSLEGDFGLNRDPGLWGAYTMVKDAADVRAIEGEIWDTIQSLQDQPIPAARLAEVRSSLKYGFLSGLSTPARVAQSLARLIAITGDLTVVEDLYSALDQVTPEDIQEAARTYLTPERSTVAVLHAKDQPLPEPKAAAAPVLLPVPDDPNISMRLWFRAGSQDDPSGKEGLAALTASMLSEAGTTTRTYDQILAELFPLAAEAGAGVDREMTVLTANAHRDVFARLYPLFLDGILNPGFRQEDFDRLKSRTLEQIEKTLRYSSDEELGKAALNGKVFAGTRYAHLDLGTVAGLKAITLEDVREFHRKYFTRDNVTLALGGAYPPDLPGRALADLARLAEGKPSAAPPPAATPIQGRKVLLVQKPGESTAISFGYPIDLHRGSREFYALWIANSWLGEHRNSVSHLYQVIREARGMNYGDYSYIEAFPQGGFRNMPPTGVGRRQQLFEVWVRPVPTERALFALRAALREVEKLATKGMSRDEFESQRSFLKKYVAQFATTTSERLGYAVDDRYYGIDQGHLKQFRRMMDEITVEEVNAAVRKHIRATDLVITMVTADAEGLKKALLADAPSPIDYGGIEKPAEILKEDKEIERYPLKVKGQDITIVPVEEMFTR